MAELSERDIARPPSPFARKIAPAIVALAALFAFGAAVWYAYDRGAPAGGAGVTPIIRAQPGPVRERPEDPGGLDVPDRDRQVWRRISPLPQQPVNESLAPSPEVPLARPAVDPPAAPSANEGAVARTNDPIGALIARQDDDAPAPDTPAEASRPAAPAASGTVPTAPGTAQPERSATVAPLLVRPPAQPAPGSSGAAAAPPPAAQGQVRIQVASLGSEADAERQARRLRARFDAVLGDASTLIQRADLGQRGVFYRLQFVGFADRNAARAVCSTLKAQNQDCLVVVR